MQIAAALFVLVSLASTPAPVSAQSLGRGDYQRCAVYDRYGDFSGHDSVCLAARRAALRDLNADRYGGDRYGDRYDGSYGRARPRRSMAADSGIHFCPHWANQGRGWSVGGVTDYGSGLYASGYATADAPVNGRLRAPRPVNYHDTGYY